MMLPPRQRTALESVLEQFLREEQIILNKAYNYGLDAYEVRSRAERFNEIVTLYTREFDDYDDWMQYSEEEIMAQICMLP